MGGGAWWAAVHRVAKSQTRLSDFTFTFHFHALEKEMATHSSVLAWRIPGTEEPGGLPSMGSQSWTQLKRLNSSSSNSRININNLKTRQSYLQAWSNFEEIRGMLNEMSPQELAILNGFFFPPISQSFNLINPSFINMLQKSGLANHP